MRPTTVCALLSGLAVALLAAEPAWAQQQGSSRTLFELFVWPGGGWIGVLILLLDVASIALIIEHFWTIRRSTILPGPLAGQVRAAIAAQQYAKALELTSREPSFLSHVVHATLQEAAHGYAAMEQALAEAVEERTTRLLRKIEALNVLGNVGPMLGLLGTVLGMILAFEEIVKEGGVPKPAALAHSIGIALVTTFWGLIVAVPALAAYAVLRNRIDALSAETALTVQELIGTLKPTARRTAVSQTAGAG